MDVRVRMDSKELKRLRKDLNALGVEKMPRAATRALNRAAQSTRTAILREASGETGIKRKRLDRRIRFQRRDEARKEKLRSQVFLVVSDVPVTYLGAPRQLKKGAKVKGRTYERAFVATVGKHTGVYRRPNAGHGKMTAKQYRAILQKKGIDAVERQFRFPLREIKETIRAGMTGVSERMVEQVGEPEFRKRFYHEVERAFRER